MFKESCVLQKQLQHFNYFFLSFSSPSSPKSEKDVIHILSLHPAVYQPQRIVGTFNESPLSLYGDCFRIVLEKVANFTDFRVVNFLQNFRVALWRHSPSNTHQPHEHRHKDSRSCHFSTVEDEGSRECK